MSAARSAATRPPLSGPANTSRSESSPSSASASIALSGSLRGWIVPTTSAYGAPSSRGPFGVNAGSTPFGVTTIFSCGMS